MAVSVDYVARETASNLWRNKLMTIAAVLTVAVSLSLVGTAMLLRQGVANATVQWAHGVNVNVFMVPGISDGQRKSLQAELHQLPYVRTCLYRSQTYDYSEAKKLLPPDEYQALTEASMPSSLRCVLNDPSQARAVYQQFKGRPGVASVSYPDQAVRNIQTVTTILQRVFLALAVILLLSASVLILNTIRLAIFARRREVSVMKLVGATNWFIRMPFLCEGLVQGVVGALFAGAVVFGLHVALDSFSSGSVTSIWYQMRTPLSQVVVTSVVVVLVGVFVGTVGSAFAIRRFLDA